MIRTRCLQTSVFQGRPFSEPTQTCPLCTSTCPTVSGVVRSRCVRTEACGSPPRHWRRHVAAFGQSEKMEVKGRHQWRLRSELLDYREDVSYTRGTAGLLIGNCDLPRVSLDRSIADRDQLFRANEEHRRYILEVTDVPRGHIGRSRATSADVPRGCATQSDFAIHPGQRSNVLTFCVFIGTCRGRT